MELAIQLFGYLILTFLGVVAPVLLILLSIFREGTLKLAAQYENEKSKSEANIKEQLKKLGEQQETDVKQIKQSIKKLEDTQKIAETKLSYLNPKMQILWLFIPLLLSFLGVILSLLLLTSVKIYYVIFFLFGSLICLGYALFTLWKLLGIIVEVRKTIDTDERGADTKIIELLSKLAEKAGTEVQYFLKDVYITLNDKNIDDKLGKVPITAYKKQEVEIGIRNSEKRMAKNIEIGLIFPLDFIIEKTGYYSVYTDKTNQIVRYEASLIHGNTIFRLSPLIITALKKGDYKIQTFIKAENIESTYRDLILKVS